MLMIPIIGLFMSFGCSALVARVHAVWRTPTWLVAVLTPVFVVVAWVAMKAMPFFGVFTELPLVFLATLAASGPVAIMQRANEELFRLREEQKKKGHAVEMQGQESKRPEKRVQPLGILYLALFLPTMAITMSTLLSRLNYAWWLSWSCDGKIAVVARDSGNHAAPMILVETDGSTEKFTQVDSDFWAQAKPGMRLTKAPGSPRALLDGRLVRMVPLQMEWWNDPK